MSSEGDDETRMPGVDWDEVDACCVVLSGCVVSFFALLPYVDMYSSLKNDECTRKEFIDDEVSGWTEGVSSRRGYVVYTGPFVGVCR